MDLYCKMGRELRSLFKDLFDPRHAGVVREKMGRILATASQIGSPLKEEAEQLHTDVVQFLERPQDPKRLAVMKQHALRLEQETREI